MRCALGFLLIFASWTSSALAEASSQELHAWTQSAMKEFSLVPAKTFAAASRGWVALPDGGQLRANRLQDLVVAGLVKQDGALLVFSVDGKGLVVFGLPSGGLSARVLDSLIDGSAFGLGLGGKAAGGMGPLIGLNGPFTSRFGADPISNLLSTLLPNRTMSLEVRQSYAMDFWGVVNKIVTVAGVIAVGISVVITGGASTPLVAAWATAAAAATNVAAIAEELQKSPPNPAPTSTPDADPQPTPDPNPPEPSKGPEGAHGTPAKTPEPPKEPTVGPGEPSGGAPPPAPTPPPAEDPKKMPTADGYHRPSPYDPAVQRMMNIVAAQGGVIFFIHTRGKFDPNPNADSAVRPKLNVTLGEAKAQKLAQVTNPNPESSSQASRPRQRWNQAGQKFGSLSPLIQPSYDQNPSSSLPKVLGGDGSHIGGSGVGDGADPDDHNP